MNHDPYQDVVEALTRDLCRYIKMGMDEREVLQALQCVLISFTATMCIRFGHDSHSIRFWLRRATKEIESSILEMIDTELNN